MKINLDNVELFNNCHTPYKPHKFLFDLQAVPSYNQQIIQEKSKRKESNSSLGNFSDEEERKDIVQSISVTVSPSVKHSREKKTRIIGEQTPGYIGLPSIKVFNTKYKVCNKAPCLEHTNSACFAYLRECETSRRPPRKNGVVNERGLSNIINLKYYFEQLLFNRRFLR